MMVSKETSPRKIQWEQVLEENLEQRDRDLQRRIFSEAMTAGEILVELSDESINEQSLLFLIDLMSETIVDCLTAGNIPIQNLYILPTDELSPVVAGDIAVFGNNACLLTIKAELMCKALAELGQIHLEKQLSSVAELLYIIAHEIGHLRQELVLAVEDQVPKIDDLPLGIETAEELILAMEYLAHPLEAHASAFATRYIRAKQADPAPNFYWQSIDFSEILMKEWTDKNKAKMLKMRLLKDQLQLELEKNLPAEQKDQLTARYKRMVARLEQWANNWQANWGEGGRIRKILLGQRNNHSSNPNNNRTSSAPSGKPASSG